MRRAPGRRHSGPSGPGAPLTLAPPNPAAPAPDGAQGPEAPDLRPFLVSPAEIPVPGFGEPVVGPLGEDAVNGIVARFDSETGDRLLGETIVVLPDPEAAASATRGAAASTGGQRRVQLDPGPGRQRRCDHHRVPAGRGGLDVAAVQPGTAAVAMDFRSPADEPTPPDVVLEAGARQAARLAATFG